MTAHDEHVSHKKDGRTVAASPRWPAPSPYLRHHYVVFILGRNQQGREVWYSFISALFVLSFCCVCWCCCCLRHTLIPCCLHFCRRSVPVAYVGSEHITFLIHANGFCQAIGRSNATNSVGAHMSRGPAGELYEKPHGFTVCVRGLLGLLVCVV